MTTEAMWMAGGFFELSYNITSTTTTAHEIESYAKTTGDGSQTWDGNMPIKVTVTVNPGVIQGSTAPGTAGLSTGNGPWPTGSVITIINNGTISGKGGDGGGNPQGAGQPGGNAIELNYPVSIQNNGTISGGGGGGGGGQTAGGTNPPGPPPGEAQGPNPGNPWSATGGSGGGGAGYQPGDPGGSTTGGGGAGYRAGVGGARGAAGSGGSAGSSGGSAGYYIKQNSNTPTWTATGTRHGSAQP